MKRLILSLLFCLSLAAPVFAVPADPEAAAINRVLDAQSAAWNRGDIDAFMEGYWKSDELRFASGGVITYGWKTTRDRYRRNYPDKATMGTLAFTIHEVNVLSADAAIVFGRWELTRKHDKPWGLFTLTFRKLDGAWLIVSDHTSSAAEK
jgi:ketosteroid isomerase-like protein